MFFEKTKNRHLICLREETAVAGTGKEMLKIRGNPIGEGTGNISIVRSQLR